MGHRLCVCVSSCRPCKPTDHRALDAAQRRTTGTRYATSPVQRRRRRQNIITTAGASRCRLMPDWRQRPSDSVSTASHIPKPTVTIQCNADPYVQGEPKIPQHENHDISEIYNKTTPQHACSMQATIIFNTSNNWRVATSKHYYAKIFL